MRKKISCSLLFVFLFICSNAYGFIDVYLNDSPCLGAANGVEGCPTVTERSCPNPASDCGVLGIGCYDMTPTYIFDDLVDLMNADTVPKFSAPANGNGRVPINNMNDENCSEQNVCFCEKMGGTAICTTSTTKRVFKLKNMSRNEMLPCGES
jgi:hypothetical protein